MLSDNKIINFSNRNINSISDINKLISDIEQILCEAKEAKEDFAKGNYTLSAKLEVLPPNHIECIIPDF